MKILKMWIDIGYNMMTEEEIEVPDNITEKECEEETRLFVRDNIGWGWELIDAVDYEE